MLNEMDDYKFYKVKLPYPAKPQKPHRNMHSLTAAEARKLADEIEQWDKAMEVYAQAAVAYSSEQIAKRDLFKKDVLKEFGLQDHPRADKAFSIAWEEGNSEGYGKVTEWVEKLAELLL